MPAPTSFHERKIQLKAAVLHGQEDVRIEERNEPALQPAKCASVSELHHLRHDKVYRGYHARMITPPAVFGHEFAGTITEMAEMLLLENRDRVVPPIPPPAESAPIVKIINPTYAMTFFLNGAYAESIVVPARIVEKNLLPCPPILPLPTPHSPSLWLAW